MKIEEILNMAGEEIANLYGSLSISLWFENYETLGYDNPPSWASKLVYHRERPDISKKCLFELFERVNIPKTWYLDENYFNSDAHQEGYPYKQRPIIVIENQQYIPPGQLTMDIARRVFMTKEFLPQALPIGQRVQDYNALPVPDQFK